MGLTRWFRRRPSDAEMREELEAHVAMRVEHDGVDHAAARRRLGNVLQTREAMRRVWIVMWWDTLRQDAHYTWRSWRRRPLFALGAGMGLAYERTRRLGVPIVMHMGFNAANIALAMQSQSAG